MLVKHSLRLMTRNKIYDSVTSFVFTTVPVTVHNNNKILKYLEPVSLNLASSERIPQLKIKSEKYLMKNWWGQRPFQLQADQKMTIPVFKFQDATFSSQTIQVPQQIFNNPLRRDLIYKLYNFRRNLGKIRTKATRNRATTSGSGKKIRPQKGSGRARLGDKRAPHLRKGGKAHGQKPKVYQFPLAIKTKIQALKALLSSKMVEGKIRIITKQQIPQGKTKILSKIMKKHIQDDRAVFCIITSQNFDQNFEQAKRNLQNVIWHTPYNLDVMSLFRADRILFTVDGIKQLIESINKTVYVAYRQKHQKKIEQILQVPNKQEQQSFDPEKPYQFQFKILAEYLQLYKKIKQQKPQLLEEQFSRVKKIM